MTEYKYTFWNHSEWYHSDCWNDAEKTAAKFPQCVAKAEEIGKAWIEEDKKQRAWDKKHPDKFRGFSKTDCPGHRGKNGTEQQEDCVEYFLASKIYFAWFEKSDDYKQAEEATKKQIASYYKTLAENPERATDALDAEKRSYQHKRLYEKIEEAKKIL